MTHKTCTKCGQSKPLAEFNNSKAKSCKDGKAYWCRVCASAASKEYRERNHERINAERRAKYAENPEPCREAMRERYRKDPAARRAAAVEWRKANPEKVRGMNQSWYSRNAELAKAASKAYRKENPGAGKSEADRQYQKDHYHKNKDAYYLRAAARRAMKSGSPGGLSRGIRNRLYRDQGGCCVYCRGELGDTFHLDHIIPLAKGGAHSDDNVQLLCPWCNLSKGAKMPEEFLEYLRANA